MSITAPPVAEGLAAALDDKERPAGEAKQKLEALRNYYGKTAASYEIFRDAAKQGYATACPAEKSGQDEFDFEYGDDFAKHIEAFNPTFCKVLVRYNPEADKVGNQRQAARLKRLSDYLHSKGKSKYMFELLVPPEPAQLDRVKGDKKAYDHELRPGLMVQAIHHLQDAGVGRNYEFIIMFQEAMVGAMQFPRPKARPRIVKVSTIVPRNRAGDALVASADGLLPNTNGKCAAPIHLGFSVLVRNAAIASSGKSL